MFNISSTSAFSTKTELYEFLLKQTQALIGNEHDFIANTANLASLLWYNLPQINWVGFYRLKPEGLVLGPFQGKPACIRIPLGRGVCGTAIQQKRSLLIPNVHKFPGHITCDSESLSEIVLPLHVCDDLFLGVLDIDSPIENRFDEFDLQGLEKIIKLLTSPLKKLMSNP